MTLLVSTSTLCSEYSILPLAVVFMHTCICSEYSILPLAVVFMHTCICNEYSILLLCFYFVQVEFIFYLSIIVTSMSVMLLFSI
jgi:hypothetical protein